MIADLLEQGGKLKRVDRLHRTDRSLAKARFGKDDSLSLMLLIIARKLPPLPLKGTSGRHRVLLMTSRETKQWIIPKGWPMKGRKDHKAAAQEALEEAGVTGRIHKHPMGAYTYEKRAQRGR